MSPAKGQPANSSNYLWLTLHAVLSVLCLPVIFTSDTWTARIAFLVTYIVLFTGLIGLERHRKRRVQGIER